MKTAVQKYYINYHKEDDNNKDYYKEVKTENPNEISYEIGMRDFSMLKMLEIPIDGKFIYVVTEENEDIRYAFGEVDTSENIIRRIEKGENISKDYIDILKETPLKSVYITGFKKLEFDTYSGYVPIDYTKSHNVTPDVEINKNDLIYSNNIWYIEYKKHGDNRLYHKPTFCNDKKFRYDKEVEWYRFVKVAEFSYNNINYKYIYEKEDEIYKPVKGEEYSEVDNAVDAAKSLIYNKAGSTEHMFKGYTPAYPFNTEDSSSVFRKHSKYIENQDVITVTGSGDAIIDLFMYGAKNITCFDANGTAKYYAKLKFYAIKAGLSYDEYLTYFLGKAYTIFDYSIYKKFSHTLDEDTKKYWDCIYEYLNISNQTIRNNENALFYNINHFFGSANCTFRNPNSYCNEENYKKAQRILQTKTTNNLKFIDTPLFELHNSLGNNKYNYMYLSNIMDFTSTFIQNDDLKERLKIFKKFISSILSRYSTEEGIIDTAFLKYGYIGMQDDVLGELEEYSELFPSSEKFIVEPLKPYNSKDYILSFYSKLLDYQNEEGYKNKGLKF